jgi:branched-chain amino acid transport system ATP-binding protein
MSVSSSAPLLRLVGLRAGYGRAEVLHGVSLDAAAGSVITVIGPNGAGKSVMAAPKCCTA